MIKVTWELISQQMVDVSVSPYFHVLVWMVLFDILTGYGKAIKQKRLDSKVSTNGWIRHMTVLAIVFVVGAYARVLHQQGFSVILCTGFIASYGLSLLENLEVLGVWFPPFLKEFFKQMRERKINIPQDANITIQASNMNELEEGKKGTSK